MILVVANTIIGRPGNIGFRLAKIFEGSDRSSYYFLARGLNCNLRGKSFGVFGFLSRCLNGIRRYIFPRFNSRRYDIYLFNVCVLIYFLLFVYRKLPVKTVYLCESSAFLAKFFKRMGYRVVLDVPIAPAKHIISLKRQGLAKDLNYSAFLNSQEAAAYHVCDEIIVPSDYIADIIRNTVPRALVYTFPFGVTGALSAHVRQTRSAFPPGTHRVRFGFLGNISPRKGCDLLLAAWEDFCENHKHDLVLQGRIYPSLKDKLNMRNVDLRAFADTKSFFSDIDVLIFPSLMEGSAKVVYEAISYGIPVYASEYSGAPFFDDYGITKLTELSPKYLSRRFEQIAERPVERLSLDYIDGFLSEYSWTNYRTRVLGLLL